MKNIITILALLTFLTNLCYGQPPAPKPDVEQIIIPRPLVIDDQCEDCNSTGFTGEGGVMAPPDVIEDPGLFMSIILYDEIGENQVITLKLKDNDTGHEYELKYTFNDDECTYLDCTYRYCVPLDLNRIDPCRESISFTGNLYINTREAGNSAEMQRIPRESSFFIAECNGEKVSIPGSGDLALTLELGHEIPEDCPEIKEEIIFKPRSSEQEKLNISPNPFSNELTLEGLIDGDVIRIQNAQGMLMSVTQISSDDITNLNTENFASGMYYISLERDNQISKIEKILKI